MCVPSPHPPSFPFRSSPGRAWRFWGPAVLAACVVLICSLSSTVTAEIIYVTDSTDAVPAPPGSLRWAIELSESNGVPDEIFISIDVDRIVLVAPLPNLAEGHLAIGYPPEPGEDRPSVGSLTLDGDGVVARALTLTSPGNRIADFSFEGFVGTESILIEGDPADGNEIAGCGFFGPGPDGTIRGAGVRIIPDNTSARLPQANVVRHSAFDGLGAAVLVDGRPGPVSTPDRPLVADVFVNWFGLDNTGQPSGVGNLQAIEAVQSGRIAVRDNVIAGPGDGILLDQADGSLVAGNRIGVVAELTPVCVGVDGPGIEVLRSQDVDLMGNRVLCSQVGVLLGNGTQGTYLNENDLGSRQPGTGNLEGGLRIEGSTRARVRSNRVLGNGGPGVEILLPGTPGVALSCNRIAGNAGLPILAPDVATAPPVLTGAGPLSVQGEVLDNSSGWVEMFGDAGEGPDIFQGTTLIDQADLTFSHPLPVVDLSIEKGAVDPESSLIDFSTVDLGFHSATNTAKAREETSEVSDAIPSNTTGLVYDVIRGNIHELARSSGGGVDLGEVVCLASGIPGSALPVADPDMPSAGRGFFYLARRQTNLSGQAGTYDPAVCQLDFDTFTGPRAPSAGDCGP